MDDSEAAVDSAARVHGDTPNWSFHVQDYVQKALPKADLLVSRATLLVGTPVNLGLILKRGRSCDVKTRALLFLTTLLSLVMKLHVL